MKRTVGYLGYILLAVFTSSLLMGMSGMGGTGSTEGQNSSLLKFDAKLLDTENNTVEITSVTIDGRTSFQAYMGKGKITIPFDQISRLEIKGKNACLTLKNSQRLCDLKVKELSKVIGNTRFGLYQISLSDIIWIEFSKAR